MGTPGDSTTGQLEKRRFVRYELDARVEIPQPGGRAVYPTEDLGAGGCRITIEEPLEKGAELEIRLTSPSSTQSAAGRATVVWASRAAPFRVGLQFSDQLAEQAIGFIHSILGAVAIHTGGR